MTDKLGTVVSAIELDPWGAEAGDFSNNAAFQPKFTSYERDGNGSDEAMFRRYNRWHSRFDQPDPYNGSYSLTNPQSFNRYAYVQGDPVNFVDPSGLIAGPGSCGYYDPESGTFHFAPCPITCSRYEACYGGSDGGLGGGFEGDRPRGGGKKPGELPPAKNEPHPQSRRNPSCSEFVHELVERVFNSWFFTETGQGISRETEGISNPYEKEMPASKGNPTNDFKDELTAYGQNGDVYRHILFVAGTILAGDSHIRSEFIAYDQRQANGPPPRKESIAELADDHAGIDVGNLMDRAWNGKLSPDQLQDALTRRLCN